MEHVKGMKRPPASLYTRLKRWFRRPSNPAGNVYYTRLRTPHGLFYKIGFTTKGSLVERMAYGGYGDEKLIDKEFFFSWREDAWDVEQILLDHFSKHRAFGKYSNNPSQPLSGRGQSELFKTDILGLDSDLYDPKEIYEYESRQSADGCLGILLGVALAPFTLGFSLFFILAGLSELSKKNRVIVEKTRIVCSPRPEHPAEIQLLIDSLSKQNMRSQA